MIKTTSKAAFWISPGGEFLGVGTSHIRKIIDSPEKFGLTMAYLKEVYKDHDEPLGFEGKARNRIVRKVIYRGWMRIRRYPNIYWKINLVDFSEQAQITLACWAKRMLCSGISGFIEGDGYMPVVISHPDGFFEHKTTMQDLAQSRYIQE